MKVKIGDEVYDSDKEPVLLILTAQERLEINAMVPQCRKYVKFPQGANVGLIAQWITDIPEFAVEEQAGGVG